MTGFVIVYLICRFAACSGGAIWGDPTSRWLRCAARSASSSATAASHWATLSCWRATTPSTSARSLPASAWAASLAACSSRYASQHWCGPGCAFMNTQPVHVRLRCLLSCLQLTTCILASDPDQGVPRMACRLAASAWAGHCQQHLDWH